MFEEVRSEAWLSEAALYLSEPLLVVLDPFKALLFVRAPFALVRPLALTLLPLVFVNVLVFFALFVAPPPLGLLLLEIVLVVL